MKKAGGIQRCVLFEFSFFLVFLRFSAEVLPIVHSLDRPETTFETRSADYLHSVLFSTLVSAGTGFFLGHRLSCV